MTHSTIHPSHKLQAWFDALTCEASERDSAAPVHAGDHELTRIASEAGLVRRILIHRNTQLTGPIAASASSMHQAHRNATLMRARQAGLFLPRKRRWAEFVNFLDSLFGKSPQTHWPTGSERGSQARTGVRVGVVVVGGAMLVALYLLIRPLAEPAGYPGGVVMRGDEQAQRLVVEKPSALADQIEVVLREEGVPVQRTVAGQSIAIQAKTTTISNDGRARLMAMGVVVPAHGRLHILLNPQ